MASQAASMKQDIRMSFLNDDKDLSPQDDKLSYMPTWYEKASKKLPKAGERVRGFTSTGDFFDSEIKKSILGPKDVPVIETEDGHVSDITLLRTSLPSWPKSSKKQRCDLRYSYCGRIWDGEADVAEGDTIVEVTHKDPMAGKHFIVRIPVANVMRVTPK